MSTAIDKVNGHTVTEPRFDPIALAEAAAIRARSEAETEARLTLSRAEAKAIETKAAEEAEKQRIANERAALRFEREKAEQLAKIAEANRKRDEAERLSAEADAKDEAEQQAEAEQQQAEETAANRWRTAAVGFAIACGIVALPVQISAFWNPEAWWLVAAPIFLEGGAWVVLAGAAAAVAARRPHWHYRLIAWSLAAVAAGVNLWHGLNAFDTATAVATAFASLAGPGVWDLHEHGRIRQRDGVLSRRQRRALAKAERQAAAEKAAAEERATAEREAVAKAAADAAQQLAADREKYFPKVWGHAVKMAADLGETAVTEAIWKRAKRDIEGTDPGESVDIIRGRNAADRRLIAARSEAPGSTPSKVSNAQRASQMPPAPKTRRYNPPAKAGRRTKGDTPKYVPAARKQAAITARIAATEEQK